MFCPSCNNKKESTPSKYECYCCAGAASLLICMKHFKHSSNQCLIANLPDTLLMIIASYLDPPHVYSLAQTCTQFHSHSTELSTRHFLSPPQVKPVEYMQNNTVKNLSSRLLQESLIHGFTDVVQTVNAAMSIDEARRIVKFQVDESSKGRKVLLSGSAAVQIVTGKRFQECDLNFFCSRQSASGFRQLMKDFGYCCESVLHPSSDNADEYYFQDGHIHHVENFIPRGDIETVAISTLVSDYYRAWNAQLAAIEADEEVPPEELEHIDMSFLNQRNVDLFKFQRTGSRNRFPRDYPIALNPPNNSARSDDANSRIERKNGSVQLVVCWSCPMLAIDKFSMDICKTSFDGKRVHVASINDAFNLETKGDDHLKFLNLYVPCFLSCAETFGTPNTLTHVSVTGELDVDVLMHIAHCVLKTVKKTDRCTQLTVLGTDAFHLMYSGERVDFAPRYFLDLHNRIVSLLQRALKYFYHGINVPLSDSVKILLGNSVHQHHQDIIAPPSKRRRLH